MNGTIPGLAGGPGSPFARGLVTYGSDSRHQAGGFGRGPAAGRPPDDWAPALSVAADYASRGHNPQLETRRYKTLEEYQNGTGQDKHSLLVDYSAFVNVPKLDGHDVKSVQSCTMGKISIFD